ncbi:MAG: dihydrodipicolinate synthase family protein [Thermoplasmata archaeon]|nr:dihydrodipicolinate synthase family protein [Thermoplasmata archaeon]
MRLAGLAVPIPTLFDAAGDLAPELNRAYALGLSNASVDHLFALGSLGEFPSIDEDERGALLNAIRDGLRGQTDLWAGVGAPATRRAVRLARRAEMSGASVLVATPPYYLEPTEAAIASYYRALAESSRLPLLAYNIPAKVGYALSPNLVHRLAVDGVLRGIKDTAGSLESVLGFLRGAPAGFAVFPGDDVLASRCLREGAAGAVMGLANLAPGLAAALLAAVERGESPRVTEIDALLAALAAVVRSGPFPSTTKFLAGVLRGAPEGYRSPYDPLTEAEQSRVRAALAPIEKALHRWG